MRGARGNWGFFTKKPPAFSAEGFFSVKRTDYLRVTVAPASSSCSLRLLGGLLVRAFEHSARGAVDDGLGLAEAEAR